VAAEEIAIQPDTDTGRESCGCLRDDSAAVALAEKLRVRWPLSTFLVSHRYGFIYCPIPKNACSSLKRWYVLTLGVTPQDPAWPKDAHAYCQERALTDPADLERGYFKFVFVRNPWHRLVSGYVQKFVQRWEHPGSPSRPVVEQVYRSRGLPPDHERSISFREFVEYVEAAEDRALDPHWKPQYLFLGNVVFDFMGRFENLTADFESIIERLGVQERYLFSINQISYGDEVRECVADWPATRLRALTNCPHYRFFYTDDLRKRVARRYARDVEMLGYTFE